MRHSQQLLALAVLGCVPPVAFIIYHGLQNEGWDSLRFLFYPGVETYLTATLIVALVVLSLTHLPTAARRVRIFAAKHPAFTLGALFAGLLTSAVLLWWLGRGEFPMRKFYTYLVAPRAFTLLLALALPPLVLLGRDNHRVRGSRAV